MKKSTKIAVAASLILLLGSALVGAQNMKAIYTEVNGTKVTSEDGWAELTKAQETEGNVQVSTSFRGGATIQIGSATYTLGGFGRLALGDLLDVAGVQTSNITVLAGTLHVKVESGEEVQAVNIIVGQTVLQASADTEFDVSVDSVKVLKGKVVVVDKNRLGTPLWAGYRLVFDPSSVSAGVGQRVLMNAAASVSIDTTDTGDSAFGTDRTNARGAILDSIVRDN